MKTSPEPRIIYRSPSMDRSDYTAGVELLIAKAPDHPLRNAIERGYNYINCLYLQKALDSIPPDPEDDDSDEYYEEMPLESQTPQLDRLYDKLRKLFTKQNKLSNSFHSVATDQDRAVISNKIHRVRNDIEVIMKQIDYYRRNGKMPMETVDDKYPVPDTEVLCIKKRNSLRSSVSRAEKELKEMHRTDADDDRVRRKEEFLREKKIHLTHVENALKKAGIQ